MNEGFPRVFVKPDTERFVVLLGPIEIDEDTEVSQGLIIESDSSIFMADLFIDLEHRGWERIL